MRISSLCLALTTVLAFSVSATAKESSDSNNEKKAVKEYFKNVDPVLRQNLIKNMKVLRDENDVNLENQKGVLAYMTETCGFSYTRDQKSGTVILPEIQCTYQPRNAKNPFNGMSPKFDCAFESVNSEMQEIKNKKVKVKYDAGQRPGGGFKEIPQAVLGTQLARLFGFYTNTYCPVKKLTCLNCPSANPWVDSRSQAAAVPGKIVVFKDVVFEVDIGGMTITDKSAARLSKPQGFSFNDEMSVFLPASEPQRQQAILEREQIDIWVNFIRHNDSDPHNNKLICKAYSLEKNQQPLCTNVYGTVNDYGNSFGYTGSSSKMSLAEFMKASLKHPFSVASLFGASAHSDLVTVGAAGSASGYKVSKEAVQSFIDRGFRIQQEDLLDIFDLAQISIISDNSATDWTAGFRKKIKDMNKF